MLKLLLTVQFMTILLSIQPKSAFADTSLKSSNELICWQRPNGNWFMVRRSDGNIVGEMTHGSDARTCGQMLATRNEDLVCSWNGYRFQPYNIRNRQALGVPDPTLQYSELTTCARTVAAQVPQSTVFCGWTGQSFGPFSKTTNKMLGGSRAWNTLDECIQNTAKTTFQNLVCGWNQGAYVYHIDGKTLSPKFENYKDCLGLFSMLRASSVQKQFSEELRKTAESEVDINAFRNGEPNEEVGFASWKTCEQREHAFHLTKNKGGFLTPECSPDTVYSWGNFAKVESLYNALPPGKAWTGVFERTLYTTSSAAGTFGYGSIPIRIKIKPNVRFKLLVNPLTNSCEEMITYGLVSRRELKETVIARLAILSTGRSFLEHILCSKDVIESWSFGTPEHFDEVLRDHNWMSKQNYYHWEAYSKKNGVDDYLDSKIDNHLSYVNFTLGGFNSKMNFWKKLTTLGFGNVIQPSRAADQNKQHYETLKPIYFNPN